MRRLSLVLLVPALLACRGERDGTADRGDPGTSDSAFTALQARGGSAEAMGVDQYTSTHVFEDRVDGGRIELQRDVDDPEGVAAIRRHLREVAGAFAAGDFSIPGFVHDTADVPGTRVMRERRERIRYEVRELPRGGEILVSTDDPDAVGAIHEFLAFQRRDHRTAGHADH